MNARRIDPQEAVHSLERECRALKAALSEHPLAVEPQTEAPERARNS